MSSEPAPQRLQNPSPEPTAKPPRQKRIHQSAGDRKSPSPRGSKALKPTLGILDAQASHHLHDPVKDFPHRLSSQVLSLQDSTLRMHAVPDDHIDRPVAREYRQGGVQILQRRAQIRIREKDEITSRSMHAAADRKAFSTLSWWVSTFRSDRDLTAFSANPSVPIFARFDDDD